MATKPTQLFESFTLKETVPRVSGEILEPGKWRLRMKNPRTGQDVREILHAPSTAQAKKAAMEFFLRILNQEEDPSIPTVRDALSTAIRLSGQRESVRKETKRTAERFRVWLSVHYPKAKVFTDLRPSMLDHFARAMTEEGKAYDSVRLYLRPILHAWSRVHRDFPDTVHPVPKLAIKAKRKPKAGCLQVSEVKALLEWAKGRKSPLLPILALQALGGLRIMEAYSVRLGDLDFETGFLFVRDTEEHELKNEGSERRIPLCSEALDTLREWVNGQPVLGRHGEISLSPGHRLWTRDAYRSVWVKLRDAAEKESKARKDRGEDELPPFWRLPARKLRSAFSTMAARLGAPDRHLKRYIGHAEKDVLGINYLVIQDEELRSVSDAVEKWRDLPDLVEKWQKSGSSDKKTEKIKGFGA